MSTQQYQDAAQKPEQQYNPNQQQPSYNPNAPQQVTVDNHVLMYLIAFFIPPLALFMHTGQCGNEVIIDIVLTCLFWVPGLIYALFVIHRDQQLGIQPKMNLLQPVVVQQGAHPDGQYQGQPPQKQTV